MPLWVLRARWRVFSKLDVHLELPNLALLRIRSLERQLRVLDSILLGLGWVLDAVADVCMRREHRGKRPWRWKLKHEEYHHKPWDAWASRTPGCKDGLLPRESGPVAFDFRLLVSKTVRPQHGLKIPSFLCFCSCSFWQWMQCQETPKS